VPDRRPDAILDDWRTLERDLGDGSETEVRLAVERLVAALDAERRLVEQLEGATRRR